MAAQTYQELMADKDWVVAMARSIVEHHLAGVALFADPFATRVACEVVASTVRRSLEVIHEHARSQAEIVFLSALLLADLQQDPPGAIFLPPTEDTEGYAAEVFEYYLQVSRTRSESLSDDEAVGGIVTSLVPSALRHTFCEPEVRRYILERLELRSKLHVLMHPVLSVQSGSVAADALMWLPERACPQVLLDCEQYSSTAKSKLAVPAVERELFQRGYVTIRYPSHEVLANPLLVASNLFWHVMLVRDHAN
jgi:hypothetical protein